MNHDAISVQICLSAGLTQAQAGALLTRLAGRFAMPVEIPRALLGKIVDEVFDGVIEDASVIEDIYRVIAREIRAALNQQEQRDVRN